MGTYSQFHEKATVLFSTDVASRGLDFNQAVDWVVQVSCWLLPRYLLLCSIWWFQLGFFFLCFVFNFLYFPSHYLQVDCPEDVASYIHRVGRTARYQSEGRSLLFVMPSESKMLEKLEAAKIPIDCIKVNSIFSFLWKRKWICVVQDSPLLRTSFILPC